MSVVPELRPLGVGEIVDVALKIWRRHFAALVRIVVVIVVPLEIVSSLLITSVSPGDEVLFDPATGPSEFDGGDAAAFFAGVMVALILSSIGFLLSSAATLRAVSVAYLGGSPEWRDSVRLALRRLGSLLWLSLLMGIGLMAAFIVLFVPGVWLAAAWSLAPAALVAENRRGAAALRRSFGLVRGRWWPTFGALLLAFVLQTIADWIIALPFALVSPEPGTFSAFVGTAFSSIAASVVTTPFVAAVFVLVYFDLRVRKEGFDLELLVQAMDRPGDSGEPPGWTGQPAAAPRPQAQTGRSADGSPVDPSWPPPSP